jgi:hypothetical protein
VNKYIAAFFISLIFLFPIMLFAQSGATPPGFGNDINDAPIDGGLSLLVTAGIGFGAKKLKERNKVNKI